MNRNTIRRNRATRQARTICRLAAGLLMSCLCRMAGNRAKAFSWLVWACPG